MDLPDEPAGWIGEDMDAIAMQTLQHQIATIAQELDGVIGVYVRDLATGAEVAHHADVAFAMASVVKVPILHELYRQVEVGTVDLDRRITFEPQHLVPGSGVCWLKIHPDMSSPEICDVESMPCG